MADASPWAYTPSLAFAAKMVTLNMVVFWLGVFVLFRLSARQETPSLIGRESVEEYEVLPAHVRGEGQA